MSASLPRSEGAVIADGLFADGLGVTPVVEAGGRGGCSPASSEEDGT